MAKPSPQQVTQLLEAWSQGDEKTLEQLIPAVCAGLPRLAHRYMRQERSGHPLQTTALVNEAYLRLIHTRHIPWQNRIHFLAIAACLMRLALVDHARTRWSLKGGSAVQHISFFLLKQCGEVIVFTCVDRKLNRAANVRELILLNSSR